MAEIWFFWKCGATEPALNMAWDEALLEQVGRLGRPVLRTYAWTELAATFGYFQRYAEVATLTSLRPLLRRPTGGGLVPHDNDWTYSVVIPPGHPWYRTRALESYQRMHEWLRAAFGACGLATELAPETDPAGPGQCFVGAEKSDLLHGGSKIAGAAQRRNRWGLLIQGSIQPPPADVAHERWEAALRQTAAGVVWDELLLDDALRQRATELVTTRYTCREYLQKK